MRILLEIDERKKVIPLQGLDGKIAYVSRIEEISGCKDGRYIHSICAEQADRLAIRLTIVSSHELSSLLELTRSEFRDFQDAYGFRYAEDLIGRNALSLYEKTPSGERLTGVIPLGSSRRNIPLGSSREIE